MRVNIILRAASNTCSTGLGSGTHQHSERANFIERDGTNLLHRILILYVWYHSDKTLLLPFGAHGGMSSSSFRSLSSFLPIEMMVRHYLRSVTERSLFPSRALLYISSCNLIISSLWPIHMHFWQPSCAVASSAVGTTPLHNRLSWVFRHLAEESLGHPERITPAPLKVWKTVSHAVFFCQLLYSKSEPPRLKIGLRTWFVHCFFATRFHAG